MNRLLGSRCGKPSIRHRRGVSLIEILVAVFIFLVAVIGIIPVISSTLTGSREANQRAIAAALAQEKLEELRNSEYDSIASGQDVNDQGDPVGLDEYGNEGGIYYRSWEVEDGAPMVGAKTVTVTVTWTEHRVNTYEMSTIIARPYPELNP